MKALVSSAEASTKLVPLSDLISHIFSFTNIMQACNTAIFA